nr:hypothetical protein [Tanacetum cinerariifolium]
MCMFREEEYATKALKNLTGRYYAENILRDCPSLLTSHWIRGGTSLVGTEEGIAVTAVGAKVHTCTVAMKNGDMEAVVIAEGMMIGTGIETEIENTTTRVGQGGTGAQSPLHRRERSNSDSRRHHSQVQIGSEERRAKLSNGIGGLFSI